MKIKAVCTGELCSLDNVPDSVFSNRILGDGFAFIPKTNRVVSPVSGVVKDIYPNGHGFLIVTPDKIEVLIHFGLKSFQVPQGVLNPVVKIGDKIESGALLLSFDLEYCKTNNINTITPVVFTNRKYKFKRLLKLSVNEGDFIERLVY